ncbi:MAG: hypothetical protein ABR521_08715 [Gaiellaceae bacterium]
MVAAGCACLAVGTAQARAADVPITVVTGNEVVELGLAGAKGLLVRPELVVPRPCRMRPCAIEILVYREGPGRGRVAVLGGGYLGLLVSDSTRVPGLVTPADLERFDLGSRPARDPLAELETLDRRLDQIAAVRAPLSGLLVGVVLLLAAASALRRSELLGRAALLAAPAALSTSVALALAGASEPWLTALAVATAASLGALLAAAATRDRRVLALVLLAPFLLYLVVLAGWTHLHTLSAFGPRAEDAGRFYGIPNRVETLLLVPALLGGALLGRRALAPVALLAAATVGLSWTGADGGGLVVLGAAFVVLAARLTGVAWTPRNIAVAVVGTVAAAVVFVVVDASTGGESHVTRAVREGPAELAQHLWHRLDLSLERATSSSHAVVLALISLGGLAWLASRRPRTPVRDALLVALAVSLAVNDSPLDTLGYGVLACTALWSWERLALSTA